MILDSKMGNWYLRAKRLSMKNFLSNYVAYDPFMLSDLDGDILNYSKKEHFKDTTFEYYCTEENGIKTFKLDFPERVSLNALIFNEDIPFENVKNSKLNYVFECYGECQSCKESRVNFMLHVFQERDDDQTNRIMIEKVGIYPKKSASASYEVTKFFDRESNTLYYKGINAISDNYGIGALAYFRRIIEKELLHIIKEIGKLPDAHGMEIQKLLDEHKAKGTVSSIYDNIFQHLPSSLKSLGDNPIKLLYNQTSEGLHTLTEEQAMEKSRTIQKLLEFVIVKMYEERSQIKDLREAINRLKS